MNGFLMNASTKADRKEGSPNPPLLLQPVLSTDSRNPVFGVYRQARAVPLLHVYRGAELIEVVPEDSSGFQSQAHGRDAPAGGGVLEARGGPAPSPRGVDRRPRMTHRQPLRNAAPRRRHVCSLG